MYFLIIVPGPFSLQIVWIQCEGGAKYIFKWWKTCNKFLFILCLVIFSVSQAKIRSRRNCYIFSSFCAKQRVFFCFCWAFLLLPRWKYRNWIINYPYEKNRQRNTNKINLWYFVLLVLLAWGWEEKAGQELLELWFFYLLLFFCCRSWNNKMVWMTWTVRCRGNENLVLYFYWADYLDDLDIRIFWPLCGLCGEQLRFIECD